jgi:hypothetical protein
VKKDGVTAIPVAFADMSFDEKPGETGLMHYVRFSGTITFELGTAITLEIVDFNNAVLNVVYGIRNGLPELMLGTESTIGSPSKVSLIHRGENEEEFINSMASSFTNWTQEIICGNNLACDDWNVEFVASVSAFHGDDAIVKAVCLPQSEDPDGKCLAIQVNPRPTAPNPDDDDNDDDSDDKMTIAMAVGITAGVAVVVLVVMVIVVHVLTKRKYERLLPNRGGSEEAIAA